MSSTDTGIGEVEAKVALTKMSHLWWIWLVAGIVWFALSLVILQFDDRSIKTIGVLIGCLFCSLASNSSSSLGSRRAGCAFSGPSSAPFSSSVVSLPSSIRPIPSPRC